MKFSIVIPAYNRSFCIDRAIKSAKEFLSADFESEIIVVDDGSTDDTIIKVEKILSSVTKGPELRFIKHQVNKGVCAAKNTGARAARGDWIIFLDSDDELIPSYYNEVVVALEKENQNPIHFFSCIGESEINENRSRRMIKRNFNEYMRNGTDGEKLPIVRRAVFKNFPYDEDMPGYESLSYMRIVKKYGFACIHDLTVRRYYISNQDRLSSARNMKKRSAAIAKGHLRALSENYHEMNYINILRQMAKYIKSSLIGYV